MKNFLLFLKTSMVLFVLVFASGQISGQVTIQGSATDHITIQAAINFAVANDVINVSAGTYLETLNLGGKELTIQGAGITTIIDANGIAGYAIHNFGINVFLKNFKLINSEDYGIKASGCNNLTLDNITVADCAKTGIDLNGVNTATLKDITVTGSVSGFGLIMLDSHDIDVDGISTSGNSWAGVTVQSKGQYYTGGSSNIDLTLGTFSATEVVPLLIEKDPYGTPAVYSDITNVSIPTQYTHIVYGLRSGDNYMQWTYKESLSDAKTFAENLAGTLAFADLVVYNLAELNYWVTPNLKIQDAIAAATSGDIITVSAGTYTEGTITIDKSLSLMGTGVCTISGSGGTAISVQANGVEINGFTSTLHIYNNN